MQTRDRVHKTSMSERRRNGDAKVLWMCIPLPEIQIENKAGVSVYGDIKNVARSVGLQL